MLSKPTNLAAGFFLLLLCGLVTLPPLHAMSLSMPTQPCSKALGVEWPSMEKPNILKTTDRLILRTAIPAMANLAVIPIVNTVETMWVSRMGATLTLAGQSASSSAYLASFFLISFLPTIAAPMVAAAVGSGNNQRAQEKIYETLFLALVLGGLGSSILFTFPELGLRLVLPSNAPATEYATPYLRFRALSMVFELVSATGFAAFRGALDTVTPLKISAASRLIKLVLDPLLIFGTPLGLVGATVATLVTEIVSGLTFLRLLIRRKLVNLGLFASPPSLESLRPLLMGGTTMLIRQLAINTALLVTTRRVQAIDPTGVAAAANGIVNQIYTIGFVVHVAMQGAAAALVPVTLAQSGARAARRMANRLLVWGGLTGVLLGTVQYALLPLLLPMFANKLPAEVQTAVQVPAILSCFLHVMNGPRFAGEGILMGLRSFRDLTALTVVGVGLLVAALYASPLGLTLEGIFQANLLFCTYQTVVLLSHFFFVGDLSRKALERDGYDSGMLKKAEAKMK